LERQGASEKDRVCEKKFSIRISTFNVAIDFVNGAIYVVLA
jgi:hypothetical protein